MISSQLSVISPVLILSKNSGVSLTKIGYDWLTTGKTWLKGGGPFTEDLHIISRSCCLLSKDMISKKARKSRSEDVSQALRLAWAATEVPNLRTRRSAWGSAGHGGPPLSVLREGRALPQAPSQAPSRQRHAPAE